MKKMYFCPSAAFDCPYFNSENGSCSIDGIPWEECDDAMAYHDFDEDKDHYEYEMRHAPRYVNNGEGPK